MHLRVAREQLAEVAHLVQQLLALLHAYLHQQAGDPVFIGTICFTSRCR
jgi:hypothetical protein